MAVLLTFLVAAIIAMLVLLVYSRGFSRAPEHQKVSGTVSEVEDTKRQRGRNKPQVDGPKQPVGPGRQKDLLGVSKGTVTLVDLAIVLGSRGLTGDAKQASGRR